MPQNGELWRRRSPSSVRATIADRTPSNGPARIADHTSRSRGPLHPGCCFQRVMFARARSSIAGLARTHFATSSCSRRLKRSSCAWVRAGGGLTAIARSVGRAGVSDLWVGVGGAAGHRPPHSGIPLIESFPWTIIALGKPHGPLHPGRFSETRAGTRNSDTLSGCLCHRTPPPD